MVNSLDLSINHDSNSATQNVSLLHVVSGKQAATSRRPVKYGQNGIPEEPSGDWVHPG